MLGDKELHELISITQQHIDLGDTVIEKAPTANIMILEDRKVNVIR